MRETKDFTYSLLVQSISVTGVNLELFEKVV